MIRSQMRGGEEGGDPLLARERPYSSRPQGEMGGYDRSGAAGGRRHTRWDTGEERNRSQVPGVSAVGREMGGLYGQGEESSSGYYGNRMEPERQREYALQREVGWGMSHEPVRRQRDQFYGTDRQQMGEPAYRPEDRQLMRSETGRSAVRPENEQMAPRLSGNRMAVRSDGERMGVGASSERMGMSEWMGARSETERVNVRPEGERMGVRSDRMGAPELMGVSNRMGGADRMGASGRMGDPGRMGASGMHDRMGGADRVGASGRVGTADRITGTSSQDWAGVRSQTERSGSERLGMRGDSSRLESWNLGDTQGTMGSESNRMDGQQERNRVGMRSDSKLDSRERWWGDQPLTHQPSSHYYDDGRGETGRGTSDGYKLPISSQVPSLSHQSRWESRDSSGASTGRYASYDPPRDAFTEKRSQYSQQSDPYSNSRAADNAARSRTTYPASQSYAPAAEQTRRASREYESYSPTKPQIYEPDNYSQRLTHYPPDRPDRPQREPQPRRAAAPSYSSESFGSQKYANSSSIAPAPRSAPRSAQQFQGEESAPTGRWSNADKASSYRSGYQSEYPSRPPLSQNPPRYSYSQSESRSDTSRYSQSSDRKDTQPIPRSASQQSSYDDTTSTKPKQTLTRTYSSSSQPQPSQPSKPSDPPSSQPTSGQASAPPSSNSSSESRVYVTNSPSVYPTRPVNAIPGVQMRPNVFGFRPQVMLQPRAAMAGIQGDCQFAGLVYCVLVTCWYIRTCSTGVSICSRESTNEATVKVQ